MNWKSFESKENWIKCQCHYCGKEFFVMPCYVRNVMYCNSEHKWLDPYTRKRMSDIKKGIHYSPETEFKKGHIPWDKGKKRGTYEEMYGQEKAREIKQKVSQKAKGRVCSKETRRKMGLAKKGLIRTEEHKKHLSDSLKGRQSEHKGKTYEEMYGIEGAKDLKRRLSDAHRNQKNPVKGHTRIEYYGEETAKKVTEAIIKSLKGSTSNKKDKSYEELYGKEKAKQLRILKRDQRLKQILPTKRTSIEILLENELDKRDIKFINQKSLLDRHLVDIFIEPNICIYADGDYWHVNPKKYKPNDLIMGIEAHKYWERDKKKTCELNNAGYKVYRFWEHEIKKSPEDCISRIKELSLIEKSR